MTFDRIDELIRLDTDPARALFRFSEDDAGRIMTIHKSKGLVFHMVILLGDTAAEPSVYFVGKSRATPAALAGRG